MIGLCPSGRINRGLKPSSFANTARRIKMGTIGTSGRVFPETQQSECAAKSVPMGTASASPQIPEHLSPKQRKTLRQRLHLTPESVAERLFGHIFGRLLAT